MPLIHHNNLGVYAGVSRQAVELRPDSQCQEMINCYPSLQLGVRRRNPTQLISNVVSVEEDQFIYAYDRGLAGESLEQYVITIDRTNNLRVLDISSNEYKTVNYVGTALDYLASSSPQIGFSAITVKDHTFIVNRDKTPKMIGSTVEGSSLLLHAKELTINAGDAAYGLSSLAPARINAFRAYSNIDKVYVYSLGSLGATLTVTVDGIPIKYTTAIATKSLVAKHKRAGHTGYITVNYNTDIPESMYEYSQNLVDTLSAKLSGALYRVVKTIGNKIIIQRLDGVVPTVSVALAYPTEVNTPYHYNISQFLWTALGVVNVTPTVVNSIASSSSTQTVAAFSDYAARGFVWIKQVSVDPSFPYTFTLTLKDGAGITIGTTTSAATTSNGVASAFTTWVNTLGTFSASAEGSVLKITSNSGAVFNIFVSDTYGSQASSAWKGNIKSMDDLPRSFPFKNTVLKVDGIQRDDGIAYWVKFDGNQWIEWRDPNMLSVIDNTTMPHKLVRNADFTFTLQPITWAESKVGDSETQNMPDFIGSKIMDMFFVGGRLGILTKNGIVLSEQGNLYNFFRTTILSLLDDSAITTYIDSTKSIGLEYAVELQGNIILFGDKLQFKLDANKAISPRTLSVQPVSGFEINRNVKPISSGDSVLFVVSNNGYSSLMEMTQDTLSSNTKATDVSAHVPTYIDDDIIQIVSSPRDNAIFLKSRSNTSTIYVYKHYSIGAEKAQMAWSKWEFSMDINSIFVFDKKLYLFGARYDTTVPIGEYPLVETWDDGLLWVDVTFWHDTPLAKTPSFERLYIEPYSVRADFRDIGTVTYDSLVELSEWSMSASDKKELRGNLLIKTAEISSEEDSNFYLVVEDKERGTERSIPAEYTVNRKPFISGNAKNMVIKLRSVNGDGFQINSISLEGQYNVRSKRV